MKEFLINHLSAIVDGLIVLWIGEALSKVKKKAKGFNEED